MSEKITVKGKKPVSLERGIFASISGSLDEDTLLIEIPESELEYIYNQLIDKVTSVMVGNFIYDYKMFCFIHLDSKQGPKVQVAGVPIFIETPFSTFYRRYQDAIKELENRYMGGEEYNESQLILSRVIKVQFFYQVWKKYPN